jgi:RNA polymerase sigma-70 factor, ECF subfamily
MNVPLQEARLMKKPLIPSANFPVILAAARRGDFCALGELLEACRPYLLFVANERLPRDLAAKMGGSDLVQDTFLVAQETFGKFHGSTEAELLAWLRRGLVRHLANQLRAFKQRAKRNVGREVSLTSLGTAAVEGLDMSERDNLPEVMLSAQEEVCALRLGLQTLTDEQRCVVGLRFGDNLPWEDIGQVIGISREAARKQCTRALMHLGIVLSHGQPHQPVKHRRTQS